MSFPPNSRSGSPASRTSSSSRTSSPRPANSNSDDDQPDNDLYPQPTTAPTNPSNTEDDDYQFQPSQLLNRISVENVNQGMLHMLKTFHLVNSQPTQDDDFDDQHQHFQPEHQLSSPTSPSPVDLQRVSTAESAPSPSRSLQAHSSTRNSPFSGLGNGHDLSGGSLRASSIFAIHRSLSQQSPFTEPHSQSDPVSDASEHSESDDAIESNSEPETGFTLDSPTAEANPNSESRTSPKYNGSSNRTEFIPVPPSNGPTIPLGSSVSHSDSSLTVNNMARTINYDSPSAKSRASSRRHQPHPNRKASLAKKLQQIFQLPTEEEVLGEYSCWLFHSVLLKGYLYLTAGHVCFYAYLKNNGKEADDDGDVIKAGMLTRRHSHKLKQHRQVKSWFILKDSVLSWYPSSHEPYFPTGQIDLHFCTKIESSVDPKRPNQFKLYVSSKVYTFFSDTQQTKNEWVKVLQEAVFACQHHGQNVKIAIPLTAIDSVEQCDSMQFAQTIRIKTKDRAGAVPVVQTQTSSTSREPSDAAIDDYFFGFIQESQALFELINTTLRVVQVSDNLPLATTDSSDQQVASGSASMPVTPTVFTSPYPPCQFGPIRDSTRPIVHTTQTRVKKHTRHSSFLPKLSPDLSGLVHISSGVYESTSRPSLEERRQGSTLTARLKKISSTGNKLVGSPIRPAANVVKVHCPSGPNGGPSGEQSPASPRTPSPLMIQSTPPLGGLLKPPSPSNNGSSPTDSQLGESHTYPPSHRSHYSTQVPQDPAERSPRPSQPVSPNPIGHSSSNSWGLLPGWLKGVPLNLNPIKPAKGAINTAKNLLTSGGDSSLSETSRRDNSDESFPEEEEAGLAHEEGQLSERDEHKFRAEFNFLNNPGTASESQNEMRLLLKTNCELTRGGTIVYGQIFLSTPVQTGTAWQKSGRKACVCFKGRRRIPHGVTKMILPIEELVKVQAEDNRLGLLTVQTGVLVKPETVWFEFGSVDQMRAVEAELGRLMEAQKQREEDKEGDSDEAQVPIMFQSSSSSFLTFKPQHRLHITCLTIGSRGDVQPYIALCQRLQSDGHTCRIASHGEYRSWVESYGIEYVEIGGDPAELMKICVDNGTFTLGFLKEALSKFRGWLDDLLSSSYDACKGTDLLIESPSTMAGIHIAEAMEIPYFRAFTMPWTRTREYPHAFAVPDHKMGSGYNYMTYTVFDQVFWRAMAGQVNRWRKETLGLKSTSWEKLESHKVPFLYNFSPTIVPTPLDWFEWVHITGYWFIEEDKVIEGTDNKRPKWDPEKGLVKFLDRAKEAGKKVVYIGFGSIVVPDPEALTKTIVEAVEATGVYAVVSKGWSDRLSGSKEEKQNTKGKGKKAGEHEMMGRDEAELLEPNSKIYNVSSVPHDWLFPRIDAACHHGGAGTTGASLRAGIPTIIRPFFGDQFFWAERVETLGIGSGVRKMTVKALSQALITATTDEVQIKKAKLVGEQLRSESGTARAVECIYRDLEYAKSLIKRRPKAVESSSKLPSSTSTLVKLPVEQSAGARPKAKPLQAHTYSSYTRASGSQSKAWTVRSGEVNLDSIDKSVEETSSQGLNDHSPPVAQLSSSAEDKPSPSISKPVNIPQQATNTSDEDSSWDILSQSRSDEPADLSSSFDNF